MKKLFIIISIVVIGCSSAKKNNTTDLNNSFDENGTPFCIQKKIDSFKIADLSFRPLSVTEYIYKEKKVYYVAMFCCDHYNIVYDSNCVILGYPDGGFTGRGDGKMQDFKQAIKSRIVWENRKSNPEK